MKAKIDLEYTQFAIGIRAGEYEILMNGEHGEQVEPDLVDVEMVQLIAKDDMFQTEAQMTTMMDLWCDEMRERTMTKKQFKEKSSALRKFYRELDENVEYLREII